MEREDMKQVSDRLEKENGQQPEEKDWTKELWEERCAELKEKLERMHTQLRLHLLVLIKKKSKLSLKIIY